MDSLTDAKYTCIKHLVRVGLKIFFIYYQVFRNIFIFVLKMLKTPGYVFTIPLETTDDKESMHYTWKE
ncbi:MAG: hypothetical protein HY738_04055 [Bacteroidia bacterium]|nr:hypothetical protein [Bacteroidia bacterium]